MCVLKRHEAQAQAAAKGKERELIWIFSPLKESRISKFSSCVVVWQAPVILTHTQFKLRLPVSANVPAWGRLLGIRFSI